MQTAKPKTGGAVASRAPKYRTAIAQQVGSLPRNIELRTCHVYATPFTIRLVIISQYFFTSGHISSPNFVAKYGICLGALFATHLVLLLVFRVGTTVFKKSLRLRYFKSDRDEIWQDCSSHKYASIDGVGFSI